MDKKIEDINLWYDNRDFVAEWFGGTKTACTPETCTHPERVFVGYAIEKGDIVAASQNVVKLPFNDFTTVYVRTSGKRCGDEVYACHWCGRAVVST